MRRDVGDRTDRAPRAFGHGGRGGAPGCCGAIRTRRAWGLVRNRSGGSSFRASPSIPAATGLSERTSNDAADHCCTRFSPSRPALAPRAVMPSMPASRRGRAPEAQVERVSAGAEHRRHRLGDRSELGVAVPLALDGFGVDTERCVVDEHAAVDLGEVHHPLAPIGERVERSHDVVAVDAEIEREMVTRPGGHAHVRKSPFGGARSSPRCNSTGSTPRARASRATSKRSAFPPPDFGL